MKYSIEEVLQYVEQEDVKFVRLAFCDVFGKQKNISIMAEELPRAFEYGISFDASAINGFGDVACSDLLLFPEPDTLTQLPWRPEHGKVVRMYSTIKYPDGSPFECDTRHILAKAITEAQKSGLSFNFGSEQKFYLFNRDENGNMTDVPYDDAGYMDIAPADRGENIRREICLTLEQMGFYIESSHHEEGPGQNEIDFRYSDALSTADNTLTFQTVVRTVANKNGICADFSAKPVDNKPGNGFHINISVSSDNGEDVTNSVMAGILNRIDQLTAFLNPTENSYERLGKNKAPVYVSWSRANRTAIIRVPDAVGEYARFELRSPDTTANPYLAFALLIYAAIEGVKNKMELQEPIDENLLLSTNKFADDLVRIPKNLKGAKKIARESDFIKEYIPAKLFKIYCED